MRLVVGRALPWAVGALMLGLTVVCCALSWRRSSSGAGDEPTVVLPTFTEVPAGPRAPRRDAFGAVVGGSTFAEVEALAMRRNLACKDTSARALMKVLRAKRRAERAAAGATGVDATTGASGKKWSPLESNPQVRWSCEGTAAAQLGDRARPPAEGRALFLFDSPTHPLRHASFRRLHADEGAALDDVEATFAALRETWGEPTEVTGRLPGRGAGERPTFEPYAPFRAEWRWADLRVEVSALSFGARGVDVYEAVEVPWPIRTDAPRPAAFAQGVKE